VGNRRCEVVLPNNEEQAEQECHLYLVREHACSSIVAPPVQSHRRESAFTVKSEMIAAPRHAEIADGGDGGGSRQETRRPPVLNLLGSRSG